jgi:hypothetical protein
VDIQHTWADAWLLHAILLSGGGGPTDLRAVFKAADAIEHSAFGLTELRYCTARLQAAGLIRYVTGSFRPTPKAHEEWRRIRERGGPMDDDGDRLRAFLKATKWHAAYDENRIDPQVQPAAITPEQFDAALDALRFPYFTM